MIVTTIIINKEEGETETEDIRNKAHKPDCSEEKKMSHLHPEMKATTTTTHNTEEDEDDKDDEVCRRRK